MEDALTVWRALEGKYGPLRDIVFLRDSVNKLKFAPSCIALFDKPFPPDFDYDAQVLAVELSTELPANGGPGIAAFHQLLHGPSYTVDVPGQPQAQQAESEVSDTPEAGTSSSALPTQAFSLRESSGSSPRIVTIRGSRPNAPYRHRYAQDAPRTTLILGPQHSFARLWAAFGGFAPSTAAPNMRMERTVEINRVFVEAHAGDAPVMDDDKIGHLIDAVQSRSTPRTSSGTPVSEPGERQAEVEVEMESAQPELHVEDINAEEPANYIPWSPITADASTTADASGTRLSSRGSQLSKEDVLEQRALAALEKARAAEAAEKVRVAKLARSTQELQAAAAKKAEKEKRHSKKQEAYRGKRTGAQTVAKSAKIPTPGAKFKHHPASQTKAAPPQAASKDASRRPAEPAQPEQRKSSLLGRLLGW
ncbi:hypothetical protein PENSPDRAFT_656779 [Peniophora sp. CONT]|nr:hypothetical protein PENSPDRAFT_656779 [Peniophora sp. CONT]